MSRKNVPDHIIERAVELWCRALHRPKFDNGDSSDRGFLTSGLAGINSSDAAASVTDIDQAIDRFRDILAAKLKYARDHEGEPTGVEGRYGPEKYRFDYCLSTDYSPDQALSEAANEAGVPHSLFSWKSTVNFYIDNAVGASFGYGAPDVYHYPLSGNRWLICQLRGEQMPAIIQAVEEGRLPELTIEHPIVAAAEPTA